MRRPWTPDEVEYVRQHYAVGTAIEHIAKALGRDVGSIHGCVGNHNFKRDGGRRAAGFRQQVFIKGERIVKWERKPVTLASVRYLQIELVDLTPRQSTLPQEAQSQSPPLTTATEPPDREGD